MGATVLHGLPYPEGADQPQVHLDIKALAEAVENTLGTRRQWVLARSGNASDGYAAGDFRFMYGGTVAGAPAGDWLISYSLVVTASAADAGNLRVVAGGSNLTDDCPADVSAAGARRPFSGSVGYQHTGGDLVVNVYHKLATAGGTVYTAGSKVTCSYLGRRV